jgi:transposase InsO family protein
MARLLRTAAKAFGPPKYLLTDQGGEFTGAVFERTVARLRIVHRLGSAENIFATARLERFWRTLKDSARLRLRRPLTLADLERRLETTLTHYVLYRPHQGLNGSVPAEALAGLMATRSPTSPPRGRPGQDPPDPPFMVDFLDREARAFPFLAQA